MTEPNMCVIDNGQKILKIAKGNFRVSETREEANSLRINIYKEGGLTGVQWKAITLHFNENGTLSVFQSDKKWREVDPNTPHYDQFERCLRPLQQP